MHKPEPAKGQSPWLEPETNRYALFRFTPKRTDDLKPRAVPFIGQVFTWDWNGACSHDDPSEAQYAGQQRWWCSEEAFQGWAPSEDLSEV